MTDIATIEARVPRKGQQSGVLREYTIIGKVQRGHEKAVRDALTAHLTDPRRAEVETLKKVGIHTALHALFDNDTRLVATVWFAGADFKSLQKSIRGGAYLPDPIPNIGLPA